ncbi:MAG: raffinose/stachyose/melibiose transport system substrate-binding protein [Streptosporangiaceae bacterium]|nr:raffinose/stachyose/melibiose transport system substrate-binding protein [Streptosporangiaceae bacterium]
MKRWKLAVAAAAAAALLAAGCSSGSSGGTAASPVTITIWHNYGTEQNATALNNLAKAFEKLHSNIKVTVVSQPASNYFAQLQAAAISRNGPDLGVMWTGLFTLQYKSFLKNLKGQVSAADLARIDPNALKWTSDSFNAANGPYVIPLENQFYIGFYNKSDFAKAGVTSVPTNWNQLYAACTKLKNAGYTPIVYGNGGQPLGATFYPWYDLSYMMIGAYSVQQWQGLYSGQIPWTSPAVAAQLANWTKLHSSGCTNKDVVTNTNNLGQFESGKAAMMVDGTWDTQKFTSALGSKVAAFAPPFSDTPIKGVVDFAGDGLSEMSYSQHPVQDAEFLSYMTTPAAARIINAAGLIPAITGTSTSNPVNQQMLNLVSTDHLTVYPMLDNVVQANIVSAAQKFLPSVLNGTQTVQAALQNLAETHNQLPSTQRGNTFP